MRVLKLTAENVKRLKAVEITPDPEGNLVVIGGRNSQGKTSVLDSIMYAIAGGRAICDRPVRDGEEKATIVLETEEFVITRTMTKAGGAYLKVKPTGIDAEMKSPQKKLDQLVGNLSFDPLEFSRKPPREQRELLIQLAGVDVDAFDAEIATARERARDTKREFERLTAEFGEAERPQARPDDELIDVTEAMNELNAAHHTNRERRYVVDRVEAAYEEERRCELLLKDLREQIAKLEVELEDLTEVDCAPLEEKVRTAGSRNAEIEAAKKYQILEMQVSDYGEATAAAGEELQAAKQKKIAALQDAQLPVDGLGLDDSGVTFNGIPFDQLGAAEQLRVSLGMGMALNPELRVMFVRDGSLLDADSLEIVRQMAADQDYQVWVEVVDEEAAGAFIIEDGEVRGVLAGGGVA